MNENHGTTVAEPEQAQANWSDEPWNRVKTAIVERWPHLDHHDVEKLPRDVFELERFLGEFTETPLNEIQAVVREHAPQPSILGRAGHLTEQVGDQVGPPMRSAVQRARYEVDEHPGTVAGLIFVTGIALGALVTASYFKTQQRATALQSYLPKNWRN